MKILPHISERQALITVLLVTCVSVIPALLYPLARKLYAAIKKALLVRAFLS